MRNSGSLLQIHYYHKFYNYQSLVLLVSHRIAAQADIVVFLSAVEFVWKSIWLNLQEVATCSSVYLQPPNNCVSLQQIKTQINWSGLSESNWFGGSLGFPLLSPPPYLPLHLAKYFTWIWPREWQQYLNYLKKHFNPWIVYPWKRGSNFISGEPCKEFWYEETLAALPANELSKY